MAEERTDERDLNDPQRLKDEAEAQVQKHANDLRAAKVPIETEPPTPYRP